LMSCGVYPQACVYVHPRIRAHPLPRDVLFPRTMLCRSRSCFSKVFIFVQYISNRFCKSHVSDPWSARTLFSPALFSHSLRQALRGL